MKIIITGSLGNIGKPLTTKLVAAGHNVMVISSNEDRKTAIENLGAKAAIGSVSDTAFLAQTFAGADALFAMTPPNLGGSNVILNTVNAGKSFAEAIEKAGVKRVVMLSSIGAHLENGTGPIKGLYQIEKLYEKLENTAVTFLRAGFFFTNLYNDVPMIKGAGIIGSNYSADTKIPFVHPEDIATAVAEELQKETSGKNIRYIISDVRMPAEVAKVLGTAIDKTDLPWIEFTDEQSLQGMAQAGLPEEIAGLYTEMGSGLRSGKIAEDFFKTNASVDGKIKLEDFAKEFTAKF
ncbi:NAD(P)H-binding protein [Flavobacterium sp. ANB]|uniref:NmrA family NAD(P)-binding protein n=1 Tax=unclassified Flavobacterium TaxID=196869 RepID=UPI0012B8AC5B|nr:MULTISPECIES: NAD(P)H-binding protein [unclassified Flavobacterium]MBF4515543.1 NAD(P)H-binding protein [Flavobacterium sp. ANB]MTD68546.1 NAD(P)H-binding protein [Flavobacterium sp. LC2016-13]